MIPFQERKKLRKILYSKATLVVLLILSVVVARGAWQVYRKAEIARAERAGSERYLTDLVGRMDGLEKSIDRLKSDRGVEEEIRKKFTVARPGEEMVIVVDESGGKDKNGDATDTQSWKLVNFIKSFFQ